MTVVQFGAGSIGRGFMGHLFWEAGLETVFVDVALELIAALNGRRSYPLRLVGPDRHETLEIGPVRAVDGRNSAAVAEVLGEASLACTAVGVGALTKIAPALAAGLCLRDSQPPLNVLLCENQLRCSHLLRSLLEPLVPEAVRRCGLVETVVSRMVPILPDEERRRDPLLVIAEDYARLPVDRRGFTGRLPSIPGLQPVDDLLPWVERKLFCHNLGHAAAAYLGYERGHATIDRAMSDPEVAAVVEGAMAESGDALCRKHGFDEAELRAQNKDLLRRFRNPLLGDTVVRVAREPLRKLRPEDRLIGALSLCLDHGVEPRHVLVVILAALRYDNPVDAEAVALQQRLAGDRLPGVLRETCGLAPGSEPARLIRAAWERGR